MDEKDEDISVMFRDPFGVIKVAQAAIPLDNEVRVVSQSYVEVGNVAYMVGNRQIREHLEAPDNIKISDWSWNLLNK